MKAFPPPFTLMQRSWMHSSSGSTWASFRSGYVRGLVPNDEKSEFSIQIHGRASKQRSRRGALPCRGRGVLRGVPSVPPQHPTAPQCTPLCPTALRCAPLHPKAEIQKYQEASASHLFRVIIFHWPLLSSFEVSFRNKLAKIRAAKNATRISKRHARVAKNLIWASFLELICHGF